MPKIRIDQRELEVPAGITILQAARSAGVHIPALCYRDGCRPNASCMTCVVKVNDQNRYLPSCATLVEDGMRIDSDTPDVRAVRKAALELLLSDHTGECVAPCQSICPARLEIPAMLRHLALVQTAEAAAIARADLILPGVLGRICPAPCEKGCRRKDVDASISIRGTHGFLGETVPRPETQPRILVGKRAAIVGGGPAGLAAACMLLRNGIACTVLDAHHEAGGALRSIPEAQLPHALLEAEIAAIGKLGAEFWLGVRLGQNVSLEKLRKDFEAIVLTTGQVPAGVLREWGVALATQGRTSLPGVFAAGGIISERKMAVRSIAEGKNAAIMAMQFLAGDEILVPEREFIVRCGDLKPDADAIAKAERAIALDTASAPAEARRCLQCGCAKAGDCKLRVFAKEYAASSTRYTGTVRPKTPVLVESDVLVDAGKCIACGICSQIAQKSGAPLGLAFVGRGFLVKITVPFGATYSNGVGKALEECVKACPTAALALKNR